MNIHITIVAYALDLHPLVRSMDGPGITWHVYQHSKNADVITSCERMAKELGNQFIYHNYQINRGLSRSWNDGLVESAEMGADAMMIANDDIHATYADALAIADAATRRRDVGVVECTGIDQKMNRRQPMAFALCAINPISIETIGYFDESYWPIYGEDVDWCRRFNAAGLKWLTIDDVDIIHVGSATVAKSPELLAKNQDTFRANAAYHVRKWGGEFGKETFSIPFNDDQFNLKIQEGNRRSPYPGHERTDFDILKKDSEK